MIIFWCLFYENILLIYLLTLANESIVDYKLKINRMRFNKFNILDEFAQIFETQGIVKKHPKFSD